MLQLVVQLYLDDVMEFQEFISKVNKQNGWNIEDSGEGLKFVDSKPITDAAICVETKDSFIIFIVARDAFIIKNKGNVYTTYGSSGLICGHMLQNLKVPTIPTIEAKEEVKQITKTTKGKK